MLDFDSLPRDADGAITGRYRVRIKEMPREDLVDRPIEGGELRKLHAAVGAAALEIEPWDQPKPAPKRRRRS